MYHYLGYIGAFLCLSAICSALLKNNVDVSKSISHHAAIDNNKHLIFATIMTGGLAALAAFAVGWLIPNYHAPLVFSIALLGALGLEVIAAWVPLADNWKHTVHQMASYGAALLIPAILTYLALLDSVSMAANIISMACLSIVIIFIAMFLLIKRQLKYYLYYQITYIMSFFVALLSTSV